MGRVLTNFTSLQVARQSAFNTLGGSPTWFTQEPNGSITFGAEVTTEARSPISKKRQRRKGSAVDLDSPVSYETDLTMSALLQYADGFCFATPVNSDLTFRGANATGGGTDTFTVPALTAAQAGKLQWATGAQATLLWATGYVNAGNNGLHVLTVDPTTTDTTLTAGGSTLVTETAPTNAEVSVCGIRPSSADLSISVTSGVATVTSASDINFTTLGLTVGQFVHIGGVTAANQFSAGAGFGRITAITATTLTLDKLSLDATGSTALATDTGTGETVDILFGRFIRNVAVDDSDFLEQYYQFEVEFPNLMVETDATDPDGYEYALDGLANELSFSFPLTGFATMTPSFVGSDTEAPVDGGDRKTNASSGVAPLFTAPFNTSADYERLRFADIDESGLTTDFKDWTLTIRNNTSGEKVQNFFGNKYINTGNFEVTIEGTFLFTLPDLKSRIRNNTTVSFETICENADGAFAIDIAAGTLSGGLPDFTPNESVKLSMTLDAFEDPTLGTSISFSLFPVTPTSFAA